MGDLTKEIYKDAASPAVSEVGKAAGRSVKALLSPIRGFFVVLGENRRIRGTGCSEEAGRCTRRTTQES